MSSTHHPSTNSESPGVTRPPERGGLPPLDEVLAGGGEMGALMRGLPWSKTPVGPVESWPQSLRTAVSICLSSRFPILVWWGPELVMLYNDAYRTILGTDKHPRAMGAPGREIWPEIWDIIGPMLEGVISRGEATWSEDQMLPLDRKGYVEECFFTFSYSPVHDETGGIGGIFTAVTETTERVLAERRMRLLRDLGGRAAGARSPEEACRIAAEALAENNADIPFALLYLVDDSGELAKLAGAVGVDAGERVSPVEVVLGGVEDDGGWPLALAYRSGVQRLDDLQTRFPVVPGGPWPETPRCALVLPLDSPTQERPTGILVAGVSPRLELDDPFREFLTLVASQLSASISNARAYEQERKRAEVLAELDRAKTAFFSNVSHEFRTPLTLMLGPIEDALAEDGSLPPHQRERLEVAHRNSLRLLKLVNTLLDFSRIEAGRIQATYEPTDLAALTTELASVFRAAVERAGMRLVVDTPALPEPVYVDREMWEKIVLNLLSNAFKFTFEGEIEVKLRREGNHVELRVSDTGTGIPDAELPHLFERFHRIRDARSRTHEGSGIGLALVQELVKLHGGEIRVESRVDVGSTFTVAIPTGSTHLPADRIGAERTLTSTSVGATPYVEEALRWLPDTAERPGDRSSDDVAGTVAGVGLPSPGARVLVVDDNADMRDYLVHLLGEYWTVKSVGDGTAALSAAREWAPDLVLADVMMPGLDGFDLLRKLRADPKTQEIPAILLSARAGEESEIDGLEAGADDYLVKPFTARELLARIGATLHQARTRKQAESVLRESEERLRLALQVARLGTWQYDVDSDLVHLDERMREIWGEPEHVVTIPLPEVIARIHPDDRERVTEAIAAALDPAGEGRYRIEFRNVWDDGSTRWVSSRGQARFKGEAAARRPAYLLGTAVDITERKQAEAELRASEERYRTLFTSIDEGFCIIELLYDDAGKPVDYRFLEVNPTFEKQTGLENAVGRRIGELAPTHEEHWFEIYGKVARTGESVRFENRAEALRRWYDVYAFRVGAPEEHNVAILFNDITERHRAENEREHLLHELETERNRLRTLFEEAPAAIVVLRGPEHVIEVANPHALQLWGKGDVIGKPLVEALPELVGQVFPERLDQVYRTGEPYAANGVPALLDRRGDGTMDKVLLNFVYQPLLAADGSVSGIFVHAIDVTEQVRARQEAEQARAEADEANQTKSTFLATMSHELRTPLNAILGYVDLLLLGVPEPIPDASTEQVNRVRTSARHLLQLIEEILSFSRLEAGREQLNLETIDVFALVRDTAALVEPLALQKDLPFAVHTPQWELAFETDPGKVRQMLLNLLSNAVKFTDAGEVRINARKEDGVVVVEVADSGIGIPAEQHERVFEPFRQFRQGATPRTDGTGLGLSVTRQLARLLGGDVMVESVAGQGSTFTLRLPIEATGTTGEEVG